MKKFVVIGVLSVLTLGVSGCGDNDSTSDTQNFEVHNIDVNGKNVPCIVYDDSNYGSELSCNWLTYR